MATRKQTSSDELPSSRPQVVPHTYGSSDHSFTLQAVIEMQKTLGELTSNIQALTKSVESNKSKVDDLVQWKNMILGGAITIGAIVTMLAFGIAKTWDYISIKPPSAKNSQSIEQNTTPPSLTPERKPTEKQK